MKKNTIMRGIVLTIIFGKSEKEALLSEIQIFQNKKISQAIYFSKFQLGKMKNKKEKKKWNKKLEKILKILK